MARTRALEASAGATELEGVRRNDVVFFTLGCCIQYAHERWSICTRLLPSGTPRAAARQVTRLAVTVTVTVTVSVSVSWQLHATAILSAPTPAELWMLASPMGQSTANLALEMHTRALGSGLMAGQAEI
ncbi:hypothetical protein BO71DRAFT_436082 [Aspergillus ellipticus CBS 707.79]|uniref:Uncharacterized protein n=1 Tax=Aspergillus ellipticus CBS 707.79 TaxID=1448320 RepID=A0A319EAJ8_9EURO|nr:hypothetical protein BO71DRAFT_436082 [Aspergillus ellipticus CBS 707.79]